MRHSDDYRLIESIQQQIARDLYTVPGVNGSAIGEVGGEGSGRVGLIVFVASLEINLGSPVLSGALRAALDAGIIVETVVRSLEVVPLPPVMLDTSSVSVGNEKRTDVFDPIIGGVACGPDVNNLRAPWSGTLGLVVRREDTDELGLLSNCHVMFYDSITTTVTQPARVDSVLNHPAGHDLACLLGNVELDQRETYVDAAVATVDATRGATMRKVFGGAADITGIRTRDRVRVGDAVTKSGLTTGVTQGRVKYVSIDGPGHSEQNQFAIESTASTNFSEPGDSGSVVLCGTEVMGLLWGSNTYQGNRLAVVTPIQAVMKALKIRI